MPTEQLFRIKSQLSTKELTVSDGLLLTLRALRGHLPENRLLWLNRELLGYRPEDLEEFSPPEPKKNVFPRIVMLWSPARKQHEEEKLTSPRYRYLQGTWGKLNESGGITTVAAPQLLEKSIFCNIGLQQLEAQLQEMEDQEGALFSMSHDLETGAEFYCFARELSRITEAVRIKLCQFIDEAMQELG